MTRNRALPLLLLLSVGGCAHYGTPGDPPQWCTPDAEQGREVTIQVHVELKAREPIVVAPLGPLPDPSWPRRIGGTFGMVGRGLPYILRRRRPGSPAPAG